MKKRVLGGRVLTEDRLHTTVSGVADATPGNIGTRFPGVETPG